jgi:dUTP pyrophosphatase
MRSNDELQPVQPNTALPVLILPHGAGLPLPSYATDLAAGLDLIAAVDEDIDVRPGDRLLVPTGVAIALPEGFEAQVRPRSGLALNHGLTVLNSPGTIDADYRGEIKVLLINLGRDFVTIRRGMRVAQLIVAPVTRVAVQRVQNLPETKRGVGGFGSTGSI